MKPVKPIDVRKLSKAEGEPNAVFDTTLNLTACLALNSNDMIHDRDKATVLVVNEVLRRIRQAMPSVEQAIYPDDKQPGVDPDYPDSMFLPAFQSIKDADLVLIGTSTSEQGTRTPSQVFFDRLYKLQKRFDDRNANLAGEGNKVAGVVVIGGCGAYEAASEIACRLSSMGFILPANASVVYDDGTEGKTKGTDVVMNSRAVADQIDSLATGMLRLAKLLKFSD
jgi:hypothetical protein